MSRPRHDATSRSDIEARELHDPLQRCSYPPRAPISSEDPYVRQQSSRGRRTLTALLASGVVVSAAALSGPAPANAAPLRAPAPAPVADPATPKDGPTDELDSHDAELLAKAESSGVRNVTLIISTESGEASDV